MAAPLALTILLGLGGCGDGADALDDQRPAQAALAGPQGASATPEPAMTGADERPFFRVYPIGKVTRRDGRTFLVIDRRHLPAMMGLERLTHVTVVYWFDRNDTPEKRAIQQVHPRGDPNNPLRGVFATHAPVRPNLIAISRCRIVAVRENEIEVQQIDAFDDTPILDLKS